MLVSDVCFPLHCVGGVWIVFWYGLDRGSRLGDPGEVWATWSLAQVRGTRLSEVARRTWKFWARYLAQARCF